MQLKNEAVWTQKNVTMSDKSACLEFSLTEEEILQGIYAGKLQCRENYAHGNPYFKLIRSEVEAFVVEKYGANHLKKKVMENELKDINKALNAAKRNIIMLEKKKTNLLNTMQASNITSN